MKNYELKGDCFLGSKGDKVRVDWNGSDGARWINDTKGTMGQCITTDEANLLVEVK